VLGFYVRPGDSPDYLPVLRGARDKAEHVSCLESRLSCGQWSNLELTVIVLLG
jgi:hypothetical protein